MCPRLDFEIISYTQPIKFLHVFQIRQHRCWNHYQQVLLHRSADGCTDGKAESSIGSHGEFLASPPHPGTLEWGRWPAQQVHGSFNVAKSIPCREQNPHPPEWPLGIPKSNPCSPFGIHCFLAAYFDWLTNTTFGVHYPENFGWTYTRQLDAQTRRQKGRLQCLVVVRCQTLNLQCLVAVR